ncbi:MAG: hypothetical protein FWC28_08465 [Proteobacteria bacterium]|nr:hypothetical protein [Cystobacterineae bacterium]MCL2259653.1 hypothetical protein [Cystobacterineae bacterium]MCL2315262.1 hypothetical protein [Pseudomonadota bacterium]
MKKFWATLVAVMLCAFGFASCDSTESSNNENSNNKVKDKACITANIEYIRSGTYLGPSYASGHYPYNFGQNFYEYYDFFILKSLAELEDYIRLREAEYEEGAWEFGGGPALARVLEGYGSEFFVDNNLLLILLTEGSGSIGHEVEEVSVDGDTLNVQLLRNAPAIGTADMAYWHFLLPVGKNCFDGEKVNLKVTNIAGKT